MIPVLMSMCTSLGLALQPGAPVPQKAEIAAVVTAARAKIGVLQAETRSVVAALEGSSAVPLTTTATVAFDGESLFSDKHLVYQGGRELQCVEAFDGSSGVSIVGNTSVVSFDTLAGMSSAGLAPLRTNELFWNMRWLALPGDLPGAPEDLLAQLESTSTVLRPDAQVVDGHACVVLDVLAPDGETVLQSLWLDPAVGYLPRLQQSLTPAGAVSLERRVTAFTEVAPGAFLPSAGQRRIAGDQGVMIPSDIDFTFTLVSASLDSAPALDFRTVADLLPADRR